ncbi:MAG: rhodoquinone biosynthesis methyltransferase RquA [Alphaproteobacteria bacterium]|nr:rhodoquinone biosynthesis methyltransferase RquA [Alphaproteobacteria bacterium]
MSVFDSPVHSCLWEVPISAPQSFKVSGSLALAPDYEEDAPTADVVVPDYLEKTYWWAYVRPWAIRIFEREWLVDLILWGCYKLLRDAALRVFGDHLPGRTVQLSCVYGSLTKLLYAKVEASGGSLDVVDVVKPQLENLQRKLPPGNKVRRLNMDVSKLSLPDASYDRAMLFFLMHEQPRDVREATLREAFRIVKPGGDVLILEFAKPKWWHPLRYLWLPFLAILEPFAPDIWNHEDVSAWLPQPWASRITHREKLFGSFYQVLMIKA